MGLRSKRHRVFRIILSITLAIVIAAFPICQTLVVAEALALTSAVLTVAAVFLGAMGITFTTNEALQKGAGTFFEKASASVKSFITTAAATADNVYSQVLSVPASLFAQARRDAVAAFPPTKTEVEDISGIGVPAWQALVGKQVDTFSYKQNLLSKDRLPIPIVINSIPTGSPMAGTTIIPISVASLAPVNSEFIYRTGSYYDSVHTIAYSQYSSTNVARFTGVSGNTYDYRAHIALTGNGVILSLTENGIWKASYLKSFEGEAIIRNLYVEFGTDAGYSLKATVCFEYLSNENYSWVTGTGSGYSSQIRLFNGNAQTAVNSQSVFTGYVDGRTGVVSVPTVGYIPDQSICNDKVLPGAINDALSKNPDLVIDLSIPATQQDLINAKWQDIIATQQDFIDLLNERIAALENAGSTPGTGEGTITGSVEIEIGEIALPNMKPPLEIKTLFPFCIPFDLMRAMECFVAEPVAPRFVIPLKYSNVIDEEIVLDFEMFDFIIEIVRWGELMMFTVMLAAATRNYIKW